jgi:trigger factor
MNLTRTDLNEATILLEISCDEAEVRAGYEKGLRKLGRGLRMPGFRPGKAPLSAIEKAVDPEDLRGAAAEEIVNAAYKKALEQEGINPNDYPLVELVKIERDPPACEFSAKVPLPAKVELGEYKGLDLQEEEASVSDEEVEAQIEDLRRREGKQERITDRGIEAGDMALVNIKPEGKEGDGRSFMIMAGQTFEDLDGAISGMKVDDMKSVELRFPEKFQEADWAGQALKATVAIRSITGMRLPDLDDEFAQAYSLENVDALKVRVRERMLEAKQAMHREAANDRLLDQVVRASQVSVSDVTWLRVAQRRMQDLLEDLQRAQQSPEDYAKSQGMTVEELQAAIEQEARIHVERAVIIERIFQAEGMSIDDEVANQHFIQLLRESNVPQDKVQEFARENAEAIRSEVLYRSMFGLVMDRLRELAG